MSGTAIGSSTRKKRLEYFSRSNGGSTDHVHPLRATPGGYNAFSLFRFLVTGDNFTPSPIVDTATTMSSTVPEHYPPPPEPRSEDDGDSGGSLVDFMDLLSIHNVIRCMHNARPLMWDSDMAATAQVRLSTTTSSRDAMWRFVAGVQFAVQSLCASRHRSRLTRVFCEN